MRFLDRIEECSRLKRLLQSETGALAGLYGRRRCGKARLLHELAALQTKARLLPFASRYARIITRLFVAEVVQSRFDFRFIR